MVFNYAVRVNRNVLVGCFAGTGEQGEGGFREVAFVGDLAFVVGFNEHRAGEAEQRRGVREHADDVGPALDDFVQTLHYPALAGSEPPGESGDFLICELSRRLVSEC